MSDPADQQRQDQRPNAPEMPRSRSIGLSIPPSRNDDDQTYDCDGGADPAMQKDARLFVRRFRGHHFGPVPIAPTLRERPTHHRRGDRKKKT